nr:hypothetical protein CFP56_64913 [Quercus suber]
MARLSPARTQKVAMLVSRHQSLPSTSRTTYGNGRLSLGRSTRFARLSVETRKLECARGNTDIVWSESKLSRLECALASAPASARRRFQSVKAASDSSHSEFQPMRAFLQRDMNVHLSPPPLPEPLWVPLPLALPLLSAANRLPLASWLCVSRGCSFLQLSAGWSVLDLNWSIASATSLTLSEHAEMRCGPYDLVIMAMRPIGRMQTKGIVTETSAGGVNAVFDDWSKHARPVHVTGARLDQTLDNVDALMRIDPHYQLRRGLAIYHHRREILMLHHSPLTHIPIAKYRRSRTTYSTLEHHAYGGQLA